LRTYHLSDVRVNQTLIVVTLDSQRSFWFDLEDGEYVGRYGTLNKLEHVGDVFQFIQSDGTVWDFYDYRQSDGPPGALSKVTTPGGAVLTLDSPGFYELVLTHIFGLVRRRLHCKTTAIVGIG